MHKAIISLLLAAVATTPVAAQAQDGMRRQPDWQGEGRGDGRPGGGRDWNDRRDYRREWNDRRDSRRDWNDRRDDRRWDNGRRDWNDRGGWDNRGGWNRDWRNDRRYDWQRYRQGNRNLYRLPRYYAPRGYSYRRWAPGYRIDPFFYGQGYWIGDPWQYRLPPAYGAYRWVRYFDDVMLVDVRSGIVADILYDFFWR